MAVRSDADFLLEHRLYVVRLCRILLRDADDCEDAAQQVFLNAYRALNRGVRPGRTRSWLAEIARNECRSRLRRAAAHPEARLSEQLPAGTPDPADAAVEHALVEQLQEELAELPERQREALLLREIRGLSYREVAETMDETGPAVESLLQRARRSLLRRLVGPAFALEWLRTTFARLIPPGGTAEVAAAGGAALIVAKLATVSVATVGVSAAGPQVQARPQVGHAPRPHAVHRGEAASRPAARQTFHVAVVRKQVNGGHHGATRGHHSAEPTKSNSGPGSAVTSQPSPEEAPAPAPVVAPVDNSGPGNVEDAVAFVTVEEDHHSGSVNSGPGSASSGDDDSMESDHSGPG